MTVLITNPNSSPISHISVSCSFNGNPNHRPNLSFNLPKPTSSNGEFTISLLPVSSSTAPIKAPTPPWMKAPLTIQPHQPPKTRTPPTDRALTDKVSGVRGPKAIGKIVRSIVKLRTSPEIEDSQTNCKEFEIGGFLEKLGNEERRPKLAEDMPWSVDERAVVGRPKKVRVVTEAELSLDGELLRRLRGEARSMRKWVKVKKAGVTQAVVDEILSIWKKNELVMIKFDVPLCRNMDRALEILEIKTGGLVVWTKKDVHVIYRGGNRKLTSKTSQTIHQGFSGSQGAVTTVSNHLVLENKNKTFRVVSNKGTIGKNVTQREQRENTLSGCLLDKNMSCQPINGSLYEREADRLLDGLGPRYVDWWMRKPLPVDADLLPEMVPRYKRPFRTCPPRARAKLTDEELTYLRKFARLLPTHFVLGRNRRLQGLAAAILKLWEKSMIVKIAVKWGIPNTSNEQMANELKDLTGGVLLLRNKFYIIFFRGKDFVHSEVATLLREREIELRRYQLDEEGARLKPIDALNVDDESLANSSRVGTLSEFQDIEAEFQGLMKGNKETELQLAAENLRLEKELRQQERKLYILNSKIERTAKELSKLKAAWEPSGQDEDQEIITEEERECFRKIGLKMQSCLVLGRRGVFDGVMEGLHQHWKYREVAKVITMQKLLRQVIYTARFLVAESGGLLVSIEKLKDGHAIFLYRGKNYRRPPKVAHMNLLTKREALRRSLEMQRLGSLKFFAYQRQRTISELKLKMADIQEKLDHEREFEV